MFRRLDDEEKKFFLRPTSSGPDGVEVDFSERDPPGPRRKDVKQNHSSFDPSKIPSS